MAFVHDAVVQAAATALPELQQRGRQAVAAPMVGPWNVAGGVQTFGLGKAGFQFGAVGNHLALRRGYGTHLAATRAARKVGVTFAGGQCTDAALDADLALQLRPEKRERRVRVHADLQPFSA